MFEAYAVGIRLSLINGVSSGVLSIASHFRGLSVDIDHAHRRADQFGILMLGIQRQALLGGASLGAGLGILGMFKGPIEEATKFQTEAAKLKALGVGDFIVSDAIKTAKGMDMVGSSALDNLKLLREAQSVMANWEHSKEVAPVLARMKFGIDSVMGGGGHGERSEAMFMDLIKTAELRGALKNVDTFKATANLATQAYVASGGLVKPSDMLNMIKTGGIAAKQLNDQAFFFSMLHTMQEMGGSRVGTGLMSAYQNAVMGRTTKQVATELDSLGLLRPGAIQHGRMAPDALVQAQRYIANPFEYLEGVTVPHILAKLGAGATGSQVESELARMYSNRTGGSLMMTLYRERANIHRIEDQARKSTGIEGLAKLGEQSYAGQVLEMQKKLATAELELGATALPALTFAVKELTGIIKSGTAFAREHPTATKWAAGGALGFGALATLGGTLALTSAGFRALGAVLGTGAAGGAGLVATLSGAAATIGRLFLPLGAVVGAVEIGRLAVALKGWWDAEHHEGVHFAPGVAARLADPKTRAALSMMDMEDGGRRWMVTPQGGGHKATINNTIVMPDGKVLARVVTKEQGIEASRPQSGVSGFDGRLGLTPFALTSLR